VRTALAIVVNFTPTVRAGVGVVLVVLIRLIFVELGIVPVGKRVVSAAHFVCHSLTFEL
jgi:hypothetical protein